MSHVTLPVTHGDYGRSLTLHGARLTRATYLPMMAVPKHEHALPSWTYIASGALEESFGRNSHQCSAGTLLSKAATAAHSNRYGPTGATCLLIEVADPSNFAEHRAQRMFDSVTVHTKGAVISTSRRIHAAFSANGPDRSVQIESLLLELAAAIGLLPDVTPSDERRWLTRARDHLADVFITPPSIAELACNAGVHKVYFSQAFRAQFGVSPGEYIRQCRVEYARSLLMKRELRLSIVAAMAGYSDQAHFTRWFHRATGMTPARFRKYTVR